MTLGPLMADLKGLELLEEERDFLKHPAIGGVIFFSRNYESAEQIADLTRRIHEIRKPPILLAVDQEGGRVQRFRDEFAHLPPIAKIGQFYKQDANKALKLAETAGWLMASEVLSVGVDISFAPVLDLDLGISSVIGDRSFHKQADIVGELAQAYQRGMHAAGMITVGKHFPGHGGVTVDSHHGLPIDERSLADLELNDLLPFEHLMHNNLNAIMAAHILFPQVDDQPVGFSHKWITEILREQYSFQGAIFSDDLSMGGAEWAGDYPQRAKMSLDAGCDMVLVCNKPDEAIRVAESLENYSNPASQLRLARLHGEHFPDRKSLLRSTQWSSALNMLESCENEPWLDMDLE